VFGLRSARREHALIFATSVFKGIAKDRHSVEALVIVDVLGEGNHVGTEPSRVERYGAEAVAKDAAKEIRLGGSFGG
jgi:hypothetical protein